MFHHLNPYDSKRKDDFTLKCDYIVRIKSRGQQTESRPFTKTCTVYIDELQIILSSHSWNDGIIFSRGRLVIGPG